jgi:hypothetical protein
LEEEAHLLDVLFACGSGEMGGGGGGKAEGGEIAEKKKTKNNVN